MALTDNLIAYWKLDEASGTRVDVVGGNDLTDNNTVLGVTGKINSAGQFATANAEYLSRASNAALQAGDIDFTWALWYKPAAINQAASNILIGKDNSTSGQREYDVFANGTPDNQFEIEVFRATDSSHRCAANSFGAYAAGSWYFIVAWHDATADTINICVNNGTVDSSATTGALQAASGGEFRIGARQYPGAQGYADGLIDEVGYWERVLTAGERTSLYNAGAGLAYPFTAPTSPPPRLVGENFVRAGLVGGGLVAA